MHAVIRAVTGAAPTNVPMLICGEPGTGKRFFARTIHDLSPRSRNAFVLLDASKAPAIHEADSPPSVILCRETDPGGAFDSCLEGAKRGSLAVRLGSGASGSTGTCSR
jgi:transcriptional regulator of acetoin/glycerol metabolism